MKKNDYSKAISVLQELKKAYPSYGIARHLSTALSEYGDFWGMTDKEFLFALEKYREELALDNGVVSQDYVDHIVKDAMNLDNLLDEEEGGDYE